MSQSQTETTYFCYLFFYTIEDACVGFGIIALAVFIFFYAISQYRQTSRINMLSKSVRLIYISVFLWSIAYLLKLSFGEIIFFVQKSQQDSPAEHFQYYSNITKYLFALDLTGVFIVQTILVLVIYNWLNNIVTIFSQISHMEEGEGESNSTANYLKFEIHCRRLVKAYLLGRFFFFGLLLAFLLVRNQQPEGILTQIMLILLLAQAYFVVIILFLGMTSVKGNSKLAEIVNEEEIRQMLLKYAFLLFFATTRAVVDTIFVVKNFSQLASNSRCFIDIPQEVGLNLVNVIFEGLCTHCLPILLVLRIYRVQTNADLTQSLLAAEQYTGSNDNIEGSNK